jgi:hypothetical protein
MTESNRAPYISITTGEEKFPLPEADLRLILDSINLIVSSGKGYGELVITFKKGELEEVRPTPQMKPLREKMKI